MMQRALLSLLAAAVSLITSAGAQHSHSTKACMQRINAVDEACCVNEDSCSEANGGVPVACGDACAATFVPYWADCQEVIAAIPGTPVEAWTAFAATCTTTIGSDETVASCEAEQQQLGGTPPPPLRARSVTQQSSAAAELLLSWHPHGLQLRRSSGTRHFAGS